MLFIFFKTISKRNFYWCSDRLVLLRLSTQNENPGLEVMFKASMLKFFLHYSILFAINIKAEVCIQKLKAVLCSKKKKKIAKESANFNG